MLSTKFAEQLESDLTLPNGTIHVVIIDTTSYSGNFEREMAAYVIGVYDEERGHGDVELDDFDEAKAANPALVALHNKTTHVTHCEYGEVTNAIWPTPGRLNNGYGGHFDDKEGKTGYPAYESVAVFLKESPTDEELHLIKQRAIEYGASRTGFSGKAEPITITGVRVLTFNVERTSSVRRV